MITPGDPRRVLFASSEVYPLVKTGGLADVSGALPAALQQLGVDVTVMLPAYPDALSRLGSVERAAELELPGGRASLLRGRMPGSGLPVLLVEAPALFDRPGNPYYDEQGRDWWDNHHRFALLCRACVEVAMDRAGLGWRPDLVHCNDWQTGLVPALLAQEGPRPATVFTIHNLAYQGVFGPEALADLGLPRHLWSPDGLEFYGNLSFLKGGLVYADRLTTVSPTYAQEIQTGPFGYGLDGLLRHRSDRLSGILNGIDTEEWDPARDPHLVERYSMRRLVAGKAAGKRALQEQLGLPGSKGVMLVGMVGRLVEQKGADLVVEALPRLLARSLQLVVLGSGRPELEQALREAAARHPERVAAVIGYDEPLAHRIEAGADVFLMPSRFEPCGLNQMYSLRYGTPPIARRTGGLADTVVDADDPSPPGAWPNGFLFAEATPDAVVGAVERARRRFGQMKEWRALQRAGMARDFSWSRSAREYLALYATALAGR